MLVFFFACFFASGKGEALFNSFKRLEMRTDIRSRKSFPVVAFCSLERCSKNESESRAIEVGTIALS